MQLTATINVLELIAAVLALIGVAVGLFAIRETRRDAGAMINQEGYYGQRTELATASFVMVCGMTITLLTFAAAGIVTMFTVNRVPQSIQSFALTSCLILGELVLVVVLAFKTYVRRRILLEEQRREATKRSSVSVVNVEIHTDQEG